MTCQENQEGGNADMQTEFENGVLTLHLTGHVDAANAPAFEAEIRKTREEYPADMFRTATLNCLSISLARLPRADMWAKWSLEAPLTY